MMTSPLPPVFRFLSSRLLMPGALGLMLAAAGLEGADISGIRTLFVDQSLTPDARSLAAFDLSVLNPEAKVEMEPGHALGNRYLAWLEVSRFRTGTKAAMRAAELKLEFTAEEKSSDVRYAATGDEQWLRWAVEALVDPAAKKGFDGFVLSLGHEREATAAEREDVLSLAATLRQRYPDKRLLLDVRTGLGLEAANVADGFLALGVYTREGRNGSVDWTPGPEVQKLSRHIRKVQLQGMRVFAVDYVPVDDHAAAREAAQRLADIGALPFITTTALQGINLGPLEEIARRVVVLHGWDERHTGQAAPGAEATVTARFMRPTLEWLGCQLEFRTARGADFLPQATAGVSAVILDSSLVLSDEQQRALAAWLPVLRARGVQVLLSSMPFTDDAARQAALQHLGLGGSGQPTQRLVKANVSHLDAALMKPGTRVQGRTLGFLDLTAPADAQVALSLRGQDSLGGEHHFDQAFLTNWGAVWIDPALEAAGPQLDLPAFFAAWLGRGHAAPVPDTTTRDGRRVFYSQVDGSGFSTPSTLAGFPLCGEVMRERILDRYLLPVTVAVCEAEVRAWLPDQDAADARRLEHTAQALFTLPQVQAASNSFSRPQEWTGGRNISAELNERAQTNRLDLQREIGGSLSYIHQRLLPAGKKVGLMLWPDNARPTPEALHYCTAMGVTSLAATPAGPVQLAADDAKAVRLEPMAVRCRFDDVRTEQGVKALEAAFDACAGAPLHTMTAAAYAASVADANDTRVLRVADRHWIILNNGRCRTLRLPATLGVPDLVRCQGVSGFNTHQGQLYIHTTGHVRTELVLTQGKPAQHLHLAESSTTVEFMELCSRRATFKVRDLRPVEMVFGGFEPRGECSYIENGRPYSAQADASGIVRLEVACRATVIMESLPPPVHAAMR